MKTAIDKRDAFNNVDMRDKNAVESAYDRYISSKMTLKSAVDSALKNKGFLKFFEAEMEDDLDLNEVKRVLSYAQSKSKDKNLDYHDMLDVLYSAHAYEIIDPDDVDTTNPECVWNNKKEQKKQMIEEETFRRYAAHCAEKNNTGELK
jgi:hypothetical protein